MPNQDIGQLMQVRRKVLGLTQLDLAELSDVSHTTIRKIERGEANPRLDTLEAIGRILGFQLSLTVPHTPTHVV